MLPSSPSVFQTAQLPRFKQTPEATEQTNSSGPTLHLLDLPFECLDNIASQVEQLDRKSLNHLSQTCTTLRPIAISHVCRNIVIDINKSQAWHYQLARWLHFVWVHDAFGKVRSITLDAGSGYGGLDEDDENGRDNSPVIPELLYTVYAGYEGDDDLHGEYGDYIRQADHVGQVHATGDKPSLPSSSAFPWKSMMEIFGPNARDMLQNYRSYDRKLRQYRALDPPQADALGLTWNLVHSLLGRVTNLEDFTCSSRPNLQIPMVILQLLHQRHPRCRLRILRFSFDEASYPNLNEWALLTSPNLYALQCATLDTAGKSESTREFGKARDREALQSVLDAVSDSLRELSIEFSWLFSSNDLSDTPEEEDIRWGRWPGFIHNDRSSYGIRTIYPNIKEDITLRPLGRLTSLSLTGHNRYPVRLYEWSLCTDFSLLQSLAFRGSCRLPLQSSDPTELVWLSQHGSFPNLRELRAEFEMYHLSEEQREAALHGLVSFLLRLPPLEVLELTGYVMSQNLVRGAMSYHGTKLRRLRLNPLAIDHHHWSCRAESRSRFLRVYAALSRDEVRCIINSCPLLEEVELNLNVSGEPGKDAGFYQDFGRMKHLQDATFYLDFLSVDPNLLSEPTLEELEWTLENPDMSPPQSVADLKRFLRQIALDEALAKQIWHICRGEDLLQKHSSSVASSGLNAGHTLRRLVISTELNGYERGLCYGRELAKIFAKLERCFEITRQVKGPPLVYDVRYASKVSTTAERSIASTSLDLRIFRTIWPENEGFPWVDA